MKISVIICTHNPREDYLQRTLEALKNQTLPKDQWEFLLIDNASEKPLSEKWDLTWHPIARHFYEGHQGLTHARIRGIKESQGKLLVFVDDDNVLAENYLENAFEILNKNPFLGAFSGSSLPEFDQSIQEWQKSYLGFLAIRKVERPMWANFSINEECLPWGAGLVVRSIVAQKYANTVTTDPIRLQMDRKHGSLAGGGDTDLALTALDEGFATGLFPDLTLIHLLSVKRLSPEYLLKMKYDGVVAGNLLYYIREGRVPNPPVRIWSSPGRIYNWIRLSALEKKMYHAARKGYLDSMRIIKELK